MHLRAREYATGDLLDVHIEDGVCRRVCPVVDDDASQTATQWIAPALFDLQINGARGHDFTSQSSNDDSIGNIIAECRRHGVTQCCPTVISSELGTLVHSLRAICEARQNDRRIANAVPAIHLEGPYISPNDGPRGAHPRHFVCQPDWAEFQRLQHAAQGLIRIVTLAPELPFALPFIEKLADSGVVVAIGHTAATSQQIRDAVSAGARLSTHLGNGCDALLPRHDNPLWEQMAHDGMVASIIFDGAHLPPSVVKCILRAKTPARTILTCDASPLAGLPPGRYCLWDQVVDVLGDGRIVVPGTPYLAGSNVFTDACLANVLDSGMVGLRDAIDMATKRPRELLGLKTPQIEVGEPADFIVFEYAKGVPFRVVRTI